MTNTNVTATGEKLYKRFDLQDETDFSFETLEQMKDWLATFWNDNPDEDMTDEEHDELIEGIMNSDEGELFDRLAGVDYSYRELDENGKEIIPEITKMTTSLPWFYSVTTEKQDDQTATIVATHHGETIHEASTTAEKMFEDHDKMVEKCKKELQKQMGN